MSKIKTEKFVLEKVKNVIRFLTQLNLNTDSFDMYDVVTGHSFHQQSLSCSYLKQLMF